MDRTCQFLGPILQRAEVSFSSALPQISYGALHIEASFTNSFEPPRYSYFTARPACIHIYMKGSLQWFVARVFQAASAFSRQTYCRVTRCRDLLVCRAHTAVLTELISTEHRAALAQGCRALIWKPCSLRSSGSHCQLEGLCLVCSSLFWFVLQFKSSVLKCLNAHKTSCMDHLLQAVTCCG